MISVNEDSVFGERGRECVVFLYYFFFIVVNDAVKMGDHFFIKLGVKKWKGQLGAVDCLYV